MNLKLLLMLIIPILLVACDFVSTPETIGETGPPGLQGVTGDRGPTGIDGPPGSRGFSPDVDKIAAEVISLLPESRTEPVDLSQLDNIIVQFAEHETNHPEGDLNGTAGVDGIAGSMGVSGPMGPMGPTGSMGSSGEDGIDGPPGVPGRTGAKGDSGVPGEPGGPIGEPGRDGDRGPKGDLGDKGDRGPRGTKGEQGMEGDRGPQGGPGGLKGWERNTEFWKGDRVVLTLDIPCTSDTKGVLGGGYSIDGPAGFEITQNFPRPDGHAWRIQVIQRGRHAGDDWQIWGYSICATGE